MGKATTIRSGKLGKIDLRLVENGLYFGLADGKRISEGENGDDVWRQLHDKCGRQHPRYFGFDGARKKFLQFFPEGFYSNDFAEHERNYKLHAKKKLDDTVPLENAISGSGFGENILSIYRATNLLSPFEKTRMQGALRGPDADEFIRAAARFTDGEGRQALHDMERVLKPHDNAKWTVVTYLPFLWRPDIHMFLKPEVTHDFAERTGHPYAHIYEPRLDVKVYESLLDLTARTERELAELKPRDRIDVQSFIWVIGGSYDE